MRRIDTWLVDENAEWRGVAPIEREARLEKAVGAAEAAGMMVETDFAVFCKLAIDMDPAINGFLAAPDIRGVLDADWKPAAKLVRLERLVLELTKGAT